MADRWYGFETPEFFATVKEIFRFLVDEYGFVVASEKSDRMHDVRKVIFQLGDVCISADHEQGGAEVFIFICSEGNRSGLGIGGLATFVDRESGKSFQGVDQLLAEGHFGPGFEEISDDRAKIIAQLSWQADLLRKYLDRIIALFQRDTFRRKESELEEWKKLWRKATWENGMREIRARRRGGDGSSVASG